MLKLPFDINACDLGPNSKYAQYLASLQEQPGLRSADDSLVYSISVDGLSVLSSIQPSSDASPVDISMDDTTDGGKSAAESDLLAPQESAVSPGGAYVKPRKHCIGSSDKDVVVVCQTGGFFSDGKKLGSGVYGSVWKLKYASGAVVSSPVVKDKYQFKMDAIISIQQDNAYTIKVIFPHKGETLKQVEEMAQKEAKILKTIYPEWVNSVFNANNAHYAALIMPFQPGVDLEKRIEQHEKFSWRTSLTIANLLIDIVEDISKKGYVHLDIKPSNIMLLIVAGVVQQFRLIDFGIAEKQGVKIQQSIEYKNDYFPHLSSDRKCTSKDKSRFINTASRHDFFSVGYVLEDLLRYTICSLNLTQAQAKFICETAKAVRPHYNNVNNETIAKLTEVKTAFINSLSMQRNQGKASKLSVLCQPTN